ncbi:MAG: flagellar motor switch protein FliN [Mycobacteriales bacterium]
MSLPDEFLDAFAGAEPVPAPSPEAPAAAEQVTTVDDAPLPTPVEQLAAEAAVPSQRDAVRMGPEATHLPPLPRPDLPDLGVGAQPGEQRDLRLLADVQVELAVELGRVKLALRDLLSLTPGSVLELDRSADAPVDVLVNGCLVARGEVVVIDGAFGVRVTAVVER